MQELMDKKVFTILRSRIMLIWPYVDMIIPLICLLGNVNYRSSAPVVNIPQRSD